MKATVERDLDAPAAAVVAALHALDRAPEWVPGLLEHRAEPQPDDKVDVILRLRAPRTLTLRVEVERLPDGLRYDLVEGDASTARGEIVVRERDGGSRAIWTQELAFPVAVPRLLLRELEDHVFPRWLARLDTAASTSPVSPS